MKEKAKYSALFALAGAVLGLLLLLLGSFGVAQKDEREASSADEIEAYSAYLEEQAMRLCESVQGVSNVTVAVTLEGSFEQIYAADKSSTAVGNTLEYVKLGNGSSAQLCAVSVVAPKVSGIGVTCRGGRNEKVRVELISLLSAVFDVGTNKIYITEAE
jgi:hypothetical protein